MCEDCVGNASGHVGRTLVSKHAERSHKSTGHSVHCADRAVTAGVGEGHAL
jgi:hypothetical protein